MYGGSPREEISYATLDATLYLYAPHSLRVTQVRRVCYTLYSFMLTYIKASSNNGGEKLVKVSWATSLLHTHDLKGCAVLFSSQYQ